ncbi:uncharacterized protein LOC107868618 [Capsicum annuum]|uniref:uncharacterized protein LOC107868618 n=1 Tax=Capsicum annuum TaxID=4072 RepID=UPI001FB11B80|nr:uncharacterized protein LOC107868618 [Capsicum annuum]
MECYRLTKQAIAKVFVEYYQNLLGKKEYGREIANAGLLRQGTILNTEEQLMLVQAYTQNEVKDAMFSIDINKSLGLDRYGSGFFRAAWSIVGPDGTQAVLEYLGNGRLLNQMNATIIFLIPKVEAPVLASQFRPIACCNVIYKCISKMICARLRKVIAVIVANNQAVFIEGRSLIHNVLICHDLLRHCKRKTTPRCLMKIDLKKAYDMVSWEVIEDVLKGYGFPSSFVQLVMNCVTITKFTIKLNGVGYGYFKGRRGL